MERSNQPPKTECCPGEGGPPDLWFFKAKRPLGSVHRELREPQAGVAPGLSNSASKQSDADGDAVGESEPKTGRAVEGEALFGLPGSKSVACEEGTDRNLGRPASSHRTNYESQVGTKAQRQGAPLGGQGIGLANSSSRQGPGPELSEGANTPANASKGNQSRTNGGYPLANLTAGSALRLV